MLEISEIKSELVEMSSMVETITNTFPPHIKTNVKKCSISEEETKCSYQIYFSPQSEEEYDSLDELA